MCVTQTEDGVSLFRSARPRTCVWVYVHFVVEVFVLVFVRDSERRPRRIGGKKRSKRDVAPRGADHDAADGREYNDAVALGH